MQPKIQFILIHRFFRSKPYRKSAVLFIDTVTGKQFGIKDFSLNQAESVLFYLSGQEWKENYVKTSNEIKGRELAKWSKNFGYAYGNSKDLADKIREFFADENGPVKNY